MNLLNSLIIRKNMISFVLLILVFFPNLAFSISEISSSNFKNKISPRLMNYSETQENSVLETHEIIPFINYATIEEEFLPYFNQQESRYNLTSNELVHLNTTVVSEIQIVSAPYHSEFYLNSEVSSDETIWYNGQEEGYGDVNVSTYFSSETPYYSFNFSENAETPASGISNINYNVTTIPSPYNYPTTLSFEFRIPWIDVNLLNNVHSLVLELRFNNASINFILSDDGSSLGSSLEPNVFKPSTNSLYILCNQSLPSEWSILHYNITRLITSYFTPLEYSNFASLKTLFCYMFAFLPEFSVTLDLRSVDYNTSLPIQVPTTYQMAGLNVFSSNGSLKYNFQSGNFTLLILENTTWKKNQLTYFNFSLTRQIELVTVPRIESWNSTLLNISLQIYFPFSFGPYDSNRVYLDLPFDWININIMNSSIVLEGGVQVNLFSGILQGFRYYFHLHDDNNLVLHATVPNYLANVDGPPDISYNEIFQITGDLISPLPGCLRLYIHNITVFLQQTTLPMVNGSFIFPATSISNEIPSGFMKFLINWSCGYEFGMYEQLICIHSTEGGLSLINIITATSLELYMYDSFFMNLSLIKNGLEYEEESTFVYFVLGELFYSLYRSQGAYYTLTINHVLWEAGNYDGTIFASDGDNFFAKNHVNITIYSATIDWCIDNLPEIVYRENDLNFRIITFAGPLEGGTTWPVPGAEFTIWINNTEVNRSVSNFEGCINILIPSIFFHNSFSMMLTILCKLETEIVKLHSYNIQISNDSLYLSREIAVLTEISQTPVVSNQTFFRLFEVTYLKNASQWYAILKSVDLNPISAHLLRDDFTLEITIVGAFLIWDLTCNIENIDTIVLEFSGPSTHYIAYEEISKYSIHIECYSDYSISNYTFQLEIDFIEFHVGKISLLDFLKRNITDKFDLDIVGSMVFLRNLNIIGGIKANYYLQIDIIVPIIEILSKFSKNYAYYEEIVGSWRFNSPGSFSYIIFYSVPQSFRSECKDTKLLSFSNDTYVVEASLPSLKWNSTVIVEMELFSNYGAISSCPSQNYTVTDPNAPNSSYFLVFKKDFIDLHLFPHEPELGSGLKNIKITSGEHEFNGSLISHNHYYIELSKKLIVSDNITIQVSDWAGNIQLIDINIHDTTLAGSDGITLLAFLPSFVACTLITGYFLTRFLKRRKNLIL